MKKAILVAFCFISSFLSAQTNSENHTVQISALVDATTPSITLSWNPVIGANNYSIFRKHPSSNIWGASLQVLSDTIHQYVDTTIQIGVGYEYRVISNRSGSTPINAYGFIQSGIQIPTTATRGGLILAIEKSLVSQIPIQIETLKLDLIGDGWNVYEITIEKTDSVHIVKSGIQALVQQFPSINSLYLLGDLPVPYSGLIGPDGHGNHIGAWPADGYYGDMDDVWTDEFIDDVSASRAANKNIPNDGKFDQSYFPTPLELAVGRVDLENMPAFDSTYVALTTAYLIKSHAFKHRTINKPLRALCDDNFVSFSEGFAQNGWRNFGPLVGKANIFKSDYFTTLDSADYYNYLWSYGCGGGTYTSANGIGNTGRFATENLGGTFSMLFGSYFGDWDSQNNFLRAALANSGSILTNTWAGRPNYFFHPMGLGESIGKCHLRAQNDRLEGPIYPINSHGVGGVHTALMGDPSLRMNYMDDPTNFTASGDNKAIQLNWTPSTDTQVMGYHLYTSNEQFGTYERLNDTLILVSSMQITCVEKGDYYFMLRPLKLETTASGSYYNLGTGVFTSIELKDTLVSLQYSIEVENPDCEIDPDGSIELTIENGALPYALLWSTGDTTTNLRDLDAGVYYLSITDTQNCMIEDSIHLEVVDTIAPIIICPEDITVNGCDISITYDDIQVFENCAISHLTSVQPYESGDVFPVGTTDFSYTVYDTHGNSGSCAFTVTLTASEVAIANEVIDHPDCFESADGAISFDIENGIPPYSYVWNPDIGNTNALDSLLSGNYILIVTDAVNCRDSAVFQLIAPDSISIQLDTIIHANEGKLDGLIQISPTGGSAPYNIQWFDRWGVQLASGSTLNNVGPDCYFVHITDANGCLKFGTFCVQTLVSVEQEPDQELKLQVFPIPSSDFIVLNGTEKIENIRNIVIRNSTGQVMKRYAHDFSVPIDIQNLSQGHYHLQIHSEKGVFNLQFIKQ